MVSRRLRSVRRGSRRVLESATRLAAARARRTARLQPPLARPLWRIGPAPRCGRANAGRNRGGGRVPSPTDGRPPFSPHEKKKLPPPRIPPLLPTPHLARALRDAHVKQRPLGLGDGGVDGRVVEAAKLGGLGRLGRERGNRGGAAGGGGQAARGERGAHVCGVLKGRSAGKEAVRKGQKTLVAGSEANQHADHALLPALFFLFSARREKKKHAGHSAPRACLYLRLCARPVSVCISARARAKGARGRCRPPSTLTTLRCRARTRPPGPPPAAAARSRTSPCSARCWPSGGRARCVLCGGESTLLFGRRIWHRGLPRGTVVRSRFGRARPRRPPARTATRGQQAWQGRYERGDGGARRGGGRFFEGGCGPLFFFFFSSADPHPSILTHTGRRAASVRPGLPHVRRVVGVALGAGRGVRGRR